ncbi:MAG: VOC family protein [Gammaproteobacteria bacterium]|nr:VOC family protein [Gammaproteobacteria bacterium]
MWLRLRQIALVAEQLAPVEQALVDVLGVAVCYRDPAVATFGLENALFPVGNQFLEVVAPTREGTAGGRYLERRGGDGGYMVICQTDDHPPRRRRVAELGVRTVFDRDMSDYSLMQLHPKDTGGSFLEIDAQLGSHGLDIDGPWHPAGPDWKAGQRLDRVTGIGAAEIQADDPVAVARRWSEIVEIPLTRTGAGHPDGDPGLKLDNATLRFVPCTDGRPEGLGGIDVVCVDRDAVLRAADRAQGALPKGTVQVSGDNQLLLGGLRITLV